MGFNWIASDRIFRDAPFKANGQNEHGDSSRNSYALGNHGTTKAIAGCTE